MSNVQRYAATSLICCDPPGDVVMASDYDALAAELAEELYRCRTNLAKAYDYIEANMTDTEIAKESARLVDELIQARELLQGALAEIDATGEAEGVYFGPDGQIDEKIRAFLTRDWI